MFGSLKKVRDEINKARATKDSATAAIQDIRGSGSETTSEAGGEVARTSRSGGRRRPGCTAYNTFQCAAPAAIGESLDGAIGGNTYHVFYRFTVDQPGVYRIGLDPMPNNQAVGLGLHDAQYNQVASFRWEAGQPGTTLHQIAVPGTYYAVVNHTYGGAAAQPYSLEITLNGRSLA